MTKEEEIQSLQEELTDKRNEILGLRHAHFIDLKLIAVALGISVEGETTDHATIRIIQEARLLNQPYRRKE